MKKKVNISLIILSFAILIINCSSNGVKREGNEQATIAFTKNGQLYTKICVINANGTGFKELTSGKQGDFNLTWIRDGSNKIIFIRYLKKTKQWQTYMTSPMAKAGEEQLISDSTKTHELGFTY